MVRTDIPKPEITSQTHSGLEFFITCPFTHDPDGGGVVYDEHDHPRGFVHTHKACEGTVPLAEYLVWLGQRAGRAYIRP